VSIWSVILIFGQDKTDVLHLAGDRVDIEAEGPKTDVAQAYITAARPNYCRRHGHIKRNRQNWRGGDFAPTAPCLPGSPSRFLLVAHHQIVAPTEDGSDQERDRRRGKSRHQRFVAGAVTM